jgi:hypothetical protein
MDRLARNRLRWKARRGLLELDLVFERFIPTLMDEELPGFSEAGYPPAPGSARFDEIRPGCYDPDERLKDMDIDGVWGQLCFPNYARFAGHRFFLNVKDRDLGLACLRTYNDYLLDEWCATDPARLYGAAILPLHLNFSPNSEILLRH